MTAGSRIDRLQFALPCLNRSSGSGVMQTLNVSACHLKLRPLDVHLVVFKPMGFFVVVLDFHRPHLTGKGVESIITMITLVMK